jgi:hypothetical protein
VAGGEWEARKIARGKNIPLGKVSAELAGVAAPAQYKLVVELLGAKTFRNEWNFWVYPAKVDAAVPAEVLITNSWPEAEQKLGAGGRVLFVPKAADIDDLDPKLSTVPIFWNRLMNPKGAWMLGMWNDAKHPALKGFPTEANCDWQWIDIAADAHALNVDGLPRALQPVVQPIDDWNRNYKLALLYECSVGAGKLMVCSIDLEAERPGARSLRRSVLDYMASAEFKPGVAITTEEMRKQWASLNPHRVEPGVGQPAGPTSPDLVDPGQIRRKPV